VPLSHFDEALKADTDANAAPGISRLRRNALLQRGSKSWVATRSAKKAPTNAPIGHNAEASFLFSERVAKDIPASTHMGAATQIVASV
jgi:hypothetical protein